LVAARRTSQGTAALACGRGSETSLTWHASEVSPCKGADASNARTEAATDLPDWEWADVDGERLVWAERGRLFAGEIGASGLANTRQLYDFNPLCFERLVAPY